jgi:hypothetical protein
MSKPKYVSLLRDAVVYYEPHLVDRARAEELFRIFDGSLPFAYHDVNDRPLRRQTCAFYGPEMRNHLDRIPAIWGDGIATLPYTTELLEIKALAEAQIKKWTGEEWNYDLCLGNLYMDGKDIIGEHSDREEYGNTKSIASMCYGVKRTFIFTNKYDRRDTVTIVLAPGSLLFMGAGCQENYTHRMIEEDLTRINTSSMLKLYRGIRINFTFRIFASTLVSPNSTSSTSKKPIGKLFNEYDII